MAFDAVGLSGPRSGLAVYSDQLARALASLPSAPELVLFQRSGPPSIALPGHNHRITSLGGWRERLARRGIVPIEATLPEVDLVHFPDVQTARTRRPCVVTVHDLAPFRLPELFPDLYPDVQNPSMAVYRRAIAGAVARCDLFICVSDVTRSELLDRFGLPEERVVTVRSGVRAPGRPLQRRPARERFRLLMVGRVEFRKNLPVAAEAVRILRSRGIPVELDVAGDVTNSEARAVQSRLEPEAAAGWLRWHGAVNDQALWRLLEETSVLLYPSLYEGFGFPALEAVRSGVPTIASDIAVHRETLGGIIPLVAPTRPEAWADAIDRMLRGALRIADDALAQLERRGISWTACAEGTVAAYRRAILAG